MKQFTKKLHDKGHTLTSVAKGWGLSRRQMDNIASNPKPRDWSALDGLPDLKSRNALQS
jgi:hypothetical protein